MRWEARFPAWGDRPFGSRLSIRLTQVPYRIESLRRGLDGQSPGHVGITQRWNPSSLWCKECSGPQVLGHP